MSLFDFFRGRPTPDSFAMLVMQQAHARGQVQKLVYDTKQFRILLGENGQPFFNLDNAYRDYCYAPRKMRAQVLQNYLAGINVPGLPSSFAEAKAWLMPVICSRIHWDFQRLQALAEPHCPEVSDVFRTLDDDTIIMLAYNTESSRTFISQATLTQWDITFNAALTEAMNNLHQRTPHSFADLGDGLLIGEWQDDYDSSRLLLTDFLRKISEDDEPLVMIPTRGRFLLASSHNAAGQLRMIALADQLMQDEGRQVSAAMYRVEQGEIVVYQPLDATVSRTLMRFQQLMRTHHYELQKELWDQVNDRIEKDIFIAKCMLLKSNNGMDVMSVATWTRGVDTLLPRTDIVSMVELDKAGSESTTKMLAWEDVLAIGGDLMQEIDCYPVRYRVQAFPTAEHLESAPAVDL
jgi:hypothetical protein